MNLETILVTGGAGYIGSRFVKTALKKNFKVILLDRFFFDNLPKSHKNLITIKADTRTFKLDSITQKIDRVIDFAAISNDPSSTFFKKSTYEINYKARVNLARQAKLLGIKQYVLPSSCSVYGASETLSSEKSKTKPLTNYAKANLMAEKEVLKLSSNKFCVTVLRFGTIFGYSPKMRLDLVLNAMTIFSHQEGKLNLMKDGYQYRPLLHIQDAINSVLFMFETNKKINNEIFNIGSTSFSNYQIINLSRLIKKNINKKIKVNWYGDPDKRNYKVDFSKIESIGFKCKYNAFYGINEMIKNSNKIDTNNTKYYTLKWYQYIEKIISYSNKISYKNKGLIF